ncbi:unnamed protein product [Clonostachys rosea]|uniref:DUF5071 domain-containing protein n=1 Tax=Bionectria ochroleuca TaxID=29856 RepID=A0ABY6UIU3_BIOOC|nr:unnamed protein product [Clonostachys rosea]
MEQMSHTTWQNYGRLLRSLQKAIQGPEAFNVETLAAATILYQTGELFSYEQHKPSKKHKARGIVTLTRERGLPNPDDPLDAMLAFENRILIESLSLSSPKESEFYYTGPWKETMERVVEKIVGEPGDSYEMGALVAKYNTQVQEDFGKITEIDDDEFFLGKRYGVENEFIIPILNDAFVFQMIISRWIVVLQRAYDEPPDTGLESRYRQICVRYWMFIPTFREEDPMKLNIMPIILAQTMEAATSEEIGHIIDVVQYIDGFRHEWGHTREQVAKSLIKLAKDVTVFGDVIEKELLQRFSATLSGDI